MEDLEGQIQKCIAEITHDISYLQHQTDLSSSVSIQTRIVLNLGTLNKYLGRLEHLEQSEISIPKKLAIKGRLSQLRTQFNQLRNEFDQTKRMNESYRSNFLMGTSNMHGQRLTSTSSGGAHLLMEQQNDEQAQRSFNESMKKTQELIDLGMLSLTDLKNQRLLMKRVQQKAVNIIGTLGVSKRTMRRIRNRLQSDTLIFYLGFLFVFIFLFLMYKWC